MINIFNSKILDTGYLSPSVKYLKLLVPKNFTFKPGQYVSLSVYKNMKKIRRPFSVASIPNENNIELCIKLVEKSETSNFIKKLKKGDEVELFGPVGNFIINEESKKKDLIFICSGTGISAFISMIPLLLKENFRKKIVLLKGFKRENEILYEKEFLNLKNKYKNFDFHNILSQPKNHNFETKGYVQNFLKKYITKNFQGHVYICGLSDMINAVKEKLISFGISEDRIFYEKYD